MKNLLDRRTPVLTLLTLILLSLTILNLSSCATLHLEKPYVSLVNFSPRPINGFEAAFDITLKVKNPNSVALPLSGMTYEIALNGESLLKGATGNLPTIPAYGEDEIQLSISTSLLSAPKILLSLLNKPSTDIRYQFKSRLDLKGMLPSFNIVEEGVLPVRTGKSG